MKNYKIAVAGTGYVGLSLGVLLSQHHQVVAVDIVQAKVDMINNKKSPIQDDYIEKYLAEKDLNLTATLDAKAAYVICVDGDDYVEQGYFSCVARSLDEFNPDMVVLSHYSLEDNKKILRKDFVVQGLLQDKEYEEVRDKFIYDPTDAECVITNSFHGMIFAVQYCRPFYV